LTFGVYIVLTTPVGDVSVGYRMRSLVAGDYARMARRSEQSYYDIVDAGFGRHTRGLRSRRS